MHVQVKRPAEALDEMQLCRGSGSFNYNWRVPKVGVNFSAGITGFGLFTEVTERTQTSISVKTAEGLDFCHYENIPGRAKGVLYPGPCTK